MFRSATTKIAHNATFGSLAGNKDLKTLQDLINAEKSLIQAWQQLTVDFERAAEALRSWGVGEGDDISDILTCSQSILFQYCAAIQQVVSHEEGTRGHLKAIRSREEALDDLRRRRRAALAKSDSAERKLSKMGPEHKNLAMQTQLLAQIQNEIRELDSQIMTDEASLGDFKRSTSKQLLALKFGGLQELSEKGALAGNYGKMIIENMPLETTQPGLPRAYYGGQQNTQTILAEATTAINNVTFSATPTAFANQSYGGPQPYRQDSTFSTTDSVASTGVISIPPHLPEQAPSLAPLDRGPSLNMGTLLARDVPNETFPPADTREFGALPSFPDPISTSSSHFRAPATYDSTANISETPASPTSPKSSAMTLGSRIAGGIKSGAGRFATFPVKGRQRTGSEVSSGSTLAAQSQAQPQPPVLAPEPMYTPQASTIATDTPASYSPTSYGMSAPYAPTSYGEPQGQSPPHSAGYAPTTYGAPQGQTHNLDSPLPPIPGQLDSVRENDATPPYHTETTYAQPQPQHPPSHIRPILSAHAMDDRPPSLDVQQTTPSESFSTSIAAAFSRGFDSDDDDGLSKRAAPGATALAAVPATSPPASASRAIHASQPSTSSGSGVNAAHTDLELPTYSLHNGDSSSSTFTPPTGDRKAVSYAPPPGQLPPTGPYAPPPGPPPQLAHIYQGEASSVVTGAPTQDEHPQIGQKQTQNSGVAPSLPPMRFSLHDAPPSWESSGHVPTPPPGPSLAGAETVPPTQALPHAPMPALVERPTTEAIQQQQEVARPKTPEEEESQLSYMSPPRFSGTHARAISDDVSSVGGMSPERKDKHVHFGAVSDVDEEMQKREEKKEGDEAHPSHRRATMFPPRQVSADTLDFDDDAPLPSPKASDAPTLPLPPKEERALTPDMDENALNAAAAREVSRELDTLNFLPPPVPTSTTRTPSPLLPPAPAFAGGRSVSPHPASAVQGATSPPPNSPPRYGAVPTSPQGPRHSPASSPPQSPHGYGALPPPPSISVPRPSFSTNSSMSSYQTPPEGPIPEPQLSIPPVQPSTIRTTPSSTSLGLGSTPTSPTLSAGGKISAAAFRRGAQARNVSGGPGTEGSPRLGLVDVSPLAIGKRTLPSSPYPQRPVGTSTDGPAPTAPLSVPSATPRNASGGDPGVRPKSIASDFEDDYITSYMSTSPGDNNGGVDRRASGYGAGKFATNLDADAGLR